LQTIAIYEPAMCCETGICGVSVDPELLRVSTMINNLKQRGVVIRRFNLSSAPQAFIENAAINRLINSEGGMDKLPATVVGSQIVKTGAYPSSEEIAAWLGVPVSFLQATATRVQVKKQGGGCCSGGGCCC